jgi:hypothetical protein
MQGKLTPTYYLNSLELHHVVLDPRKGISGRVGIREMRSHSLEGIKDSQRVVLSRCHSMQAHTILPVHDEVVALVAMHQPSTRSRIWD